LDLDLFAGDFGYLPLDPGARSLLFERWRPAWPRRS
jgi:hypothetical protein